MWILTSTLLSWRCPTEALIFAYTYLLENKALATGFVKMENSHRDIWLRAYLAKAYYM
jgi:hypothetical protein